MLFGISKNFSYTLPVLKHVAEILFMNDEATFLKLSSVSADTIVSTLNQHGVQASTPLSQIQGYLRVIGKSEYEINEFKKNITLEMMSFQLHLIPYYYTRVPHVLGLLRRKLNSEMRIVLKGSTQYTFTDTDWSLISKMFSDFVEKYCCDNFTYDPGTNGIIGFLVSTFDTKFMRTNMTFLLDIVNSSGQNVEFEGTDYSSADNMYDEIDYFEDLKDFDVIAQDIYDASSFLFRHNGDIFYDLFSRYKRAQAAQKIKKIQDILNKPFRYVSLYRKPGFEDINFRLNAIRSAMAENYAIPKYNVRNEILQLFDPLLDDNMTASDLDIAINSAYRYNRETIYGTHSNKNGMLIFDIPELNVYIRSTIGNDTRIKNIIMGMCALRDLVKYVTKRRLNLFTIPSDVFKDPALIRRYDTLKKYLDLHAYVQELRSEAKEDLPDFATNDEVYGRLLEMKKNMLRDLPLSGIREAFVGKSTSVSNEREKIIDTVRLTEIVYNFNRFFRKLGDLKYDMADLYRLNHQGEKSLFTTVRETVIEQRAAGKVDSVHWGVRDDFRFKDFVQTKVSEKVYDALIAPLVDIDGNSRYAVFSYWRADAMIKRFLSLIATMVRYLVVDPKELLYHANEGVKNNWQYFFDVSKDMVDQRFIRPAHLNLNTELGFYLAINKHIEMFTLPKDVRNNSEFDWFQQNFEFSYFPGSNEGVRQTLDDMNEHLVRIYNRLRNDFGYLFSYLDDIMKTRYTTLNSRLKLIEQHSLDVPDDLLNKASWDIYHSPLVVLPDNFLRVKNILNSDSNYGFLVTKRGNLYKQDFFGNPRYLHEQGYWVTFSRNRFYKTPVTSSDTFGV